MTWGLVECQVLLALPIPCLVIDAAGRVQFVNPSGEDMLQRSNSSLAGRQMTQVFPNDPGLAKLLDAARSRHGRVQNPGLELEGPDRQGQRVAAHLTPLNQGAWLLILIPQAQGDGGQEARAQALKTRATSLAAMAGMLAHEIKNPLAAIRGAAQLMAPHNQEMTELIVAETVRISKLLDTMELFSSPEDVDVGAVNLHETLDQVAKNARLSFGAEVRIIEDYDPSLPLVRANPHVLYRLFLNLMKNACEACQPNLGQVLVKTRFHLSPRRRVLEGRKHRADLPIEISFIDTGTGISADLRDKVFEAFVSTKEQGRGLGLAYVAAAVAAMDADVELRSLPGKTEFLLRLPQASAMPSP